MRYTLYVYFDCGKLHTVYTYSRTACFNIVTLCLSLFVFLCDFYVYLTIRISTGKVCTLYNTALLKYMAHYARNTFP